MATSLTVSGLKASVAWTFANTNALGLTTQDSGSVSYSQSLAQGTGAGYAQKIYFDQFTLAASASTNRDLAASLTDVFGNSITFARIKSIYCEATTTYTGGDVTVGGGTDGAGAAAWFAPFGTSTDKLKVRSGGVWFTACTDATAFPVTATTADILHFACCSTTSQEIKLVLIGE